MLETTKQVSISERTYLIVSMHASACVCVCLIWYFSIETTFASKWVGIVQPNAKNPFIRMQSIDQRWIQVHTSKYVYARDSSSE